MLGIDSRVARWTWTVCVVLILSRAVYDIRETIFIFILSILFAYLLAPLVNVINRVAPGRSRTYGLAGAYLVLVGLMVLFAILIGGRVAEDATSFIASAPQFLRNLQTNSPNLPDLPYLQLLKGDVIGRLQALLGEHSSDILGYLPSAGLKVLSFSSYLLLLVLVPILSFFLLKDAAAIRDSLLSLIPDVARRDMWSHVIADTNVLLGQYVRAVGILCLNTFIVFLICFSIMGVPYGILLASIAFPLEFIPLIGPLMAAAIIIVVMAATGYDHWLAIIVFLGVYRMFQDYILSPRLMSAGVEVHPLLVILGVLAGEKLGGIPGMFLSVPVIAFVRVMYRRAVMDRISTSDRVQLVG